MNCLTYLLNLWSRGERFNIFYNGNHVYALQNGLIFDFDYRQRGDESRYLPLEESHNLETVIKIFELDERFSNLLEEYYLWRC